jgi:hypothetical protein
VLYVCPTYRNGKPRTLPAASWLCVLRTTVTSVRHTSRTTLKAIKAVFRAMVLPIGSIRRSKT